MRVIETCDDPRLTAEAVAVFLLEKVLDCHQLTRYLLTRLEYFAKSALTDYLQDSVHPVAIAELAEVDQFEAFVKFHEGLVAVLQGAVPVS